jgi:ribosome-associated translation inhibitor RaiA
MEIFLWTSRSLPFSSRFHWLAHGAGRKAFAMQIHIHARGPNMNRAARQFIEDRVLSKLSRTRRRIHSIEVYLEDINGPRGGADQCVRLIVHLRPTGRVVIRSIDLSSTVSIYSAAQRALQAVRRALGRRRTKRLRGAQTARSQQRGKPAVDRTLPPAALVCG